MEATKCLVFFKGVKNTRPIMKQCSLNDVFTKT